MPRGSHRRRSRYVERIARPFAPRRDDEDSAADLEAVEHATRAFVAELVRIAARHKPRGANPQPPETRELLSWDVLVQPLEMLDAAKAGLERESVAPVCVDFGCRNGPHRQLIESRGFEYLGLDYAASSDPARLVRRDTDFEQEVLEYDGLMIPLENRSVSLVWAWSALEHCIDPEYSFSEIARITKPGGILAGSVPHLLPYHAESTANYTAYGFHLACRRHGFTPLAIYPHMDGISFVVKSLTIALGIFDDPVPIDRRFRDEPLLTPIFEEFRRRGFLDGFTRNVHAEVCGEFGFIARRD